MAPYHGYPLREKKRKTETEVDGQLHQGQLERERTLQGEEAEHQVAWR